VHHVVLNLSSTSPYGKVEDEVQYLGGKRMGARSGFHARAGGMARRQGWDGVGGALGLGVGARGLTLRLVSQGDRGGGGKGGGGNRKDCVGIEKIARSTAAHVNPTGFT
jgi:hypothetical protein